MIPVQKGIVLAGGAGTRLYPATAVLSKQLLPIYDKPMVYYPIATLMQAGIGELLLISSPTDLPHYQRLLGDGRQWGLSIEYAEQTHPAGIAQALLLAEPFVQGQPCVLILGDNIFYGDAVTQALRTACQQSEGATVFAYPVADPSRYGVVTFAADGRVLSLLEKPSQPTSNQAVTGLYVYDAKALHYAQQVQPSARGELEITDVNRQYLQHGQLRVQRLGQGVAWLDTGTHQSLLDASLFVATLAERQGIYVAALEAIAYQQGWITAAHVLQLAERHPAAYRQYLQQLVQQAGSCR